MQKTTMTRYTEKGARYYKIEMFATLFGDYVVEREYGSTKNKAATGTKKSCFAIFDDAKKLFEKIVWQKKKKGYL